MLKSKIVIILLFLFIAIASTLKLSPIITQPRMKCTWKYSIFGPGKNYSTKLNLDKLFFESETTKFPTILEDFLESKDIFVLHVDYDDSNDVSKPIIFSAFQQRPTHVWQYDPERDLPQPSGNFGLTWIWVFEPDSVDRNFYISTPINPSKLSELYELPTFIVPRFLVLLHLQRYLNFTLAFVLNYDLAQKEQAEAGGVLLPTIYTPKMFSYGFGPNTRHTNMNPLITTYLKIREEPLHILYCEKDPDPYTPSAFSAMLFRAFDFATWICLLFTYIFCALATKLVSRTDAYPFFRVVCIFFRQSMNKFKPLHLIVSFVFIPVLFPYEADITARVIAPDEPKIYNNFKELLNNSFTIFVKQVNIGSDMYTVNEYDSVIYKMAEANMTEKNNNNFNVPSCIQGSIKRTIFYRKNGLEKKCHLVKEPIVPNELSTWTFKRDRGGGFIRKKTNQMFEHGLTALWYNSYERVLLTRPNLKHAAFLHIRHEVLKIRKVAFAFVTGSIFIVVSIVVAITEKICYYWKRR
ncbi:hypothetical protein Fcan01_15420 [Folsomia candida]|uniref:Uncharacterized protein n=1 Tax=Folsomia candida TaxID=158441 RepID=A0A226DVH0_FOLCA|nr:hypothetical protein Fcan01_15420 [Folsomia candida]